MITPAFGLAQDFQADSIQTLVVSYGKWSGYRASHVITQGGQFSGPDGSSRSISTPEDLELLVALRNQADLVVVDAATARMEQYRLPKSGAKLAILSRSDDFSGIPAIDENPGKVMLFAIAGRPYYGLENTSKVHLSAEPLLEVARIAKGQGLSALLLESGPTLSARAFELGLVNSSALTITPAMEFDLEPSAVHPFDRQAKLLSVAHGSGASFTYWSH